MLLQSPYLTLEYLLWRNYNLGQKSCIKSLAGIKVSPLTTNSRNLIAVVSDNDPNPLLLKQYSGSDDNKSFIQNEHIIVHHLSSIYGNEKWLPTEVFYDEAHKLIAFEYLNGYLSIDIFGENNHTIATLIENEDWDTVKCKVQEIGQILRDLHNTDLKGLDVISADNGMQVLQLDAEGISKYDKNDIAYLFTNWDTTSLIHFDSRLTNFLHKNDDTIKLIDWELSVKGDPLWDLSITIHSICTFSNTNFFKIKDPNKPSNFTEFKEIVQVFLIAYENAINYDKLKVYLHLQIQKSSIAKSDTNQNTINELFIGLP